jgi:hypothetical protein
VLCRRLSYAADGKLSAMISTSLLRDRARRSVFAAIAMGVVAIAAGQARDAGPDVVTLDLSRPGPPI